jgi:hypothetical protein
MLRLETPTGSMELSAEQERQVRSMSDSAVCRAMNAGADLFVFAALKERPHITFDRVNGWTTQSFVGRH